MSMHYCQQGRVKPTHYVVSCKQYKRAIPAWLNTFPQTNLVVPCPLCGELRRYRPNEVYWGFPDSEAQQANHHAPQRGGW